MVPKCARIKWQPSETTCEAKYSIIQKSRDFKILVSKSRNFFCESEVFRQRGRVVPTSFAEFYCKDFRQLFKMSHDISYQF